VIRPDADVVASAGASREDFGAMSVVQTVATLAAFNDHVLPGLRSADPAVMNRIASSYSLSVEPEAADPAPFDLPSLHVFGRQDDVVGYEDGWSLCDHYVRGTYAVLDAAGHNVHLEQPGITTALVRDWLSRMTMAAD
jgi:pimeloyl-ACP methyl ester carboxylesterase